MFSIHDFVLKTVTGMIGKYPDFQVQEYALNWYSKGILTEADLATIEEQIATKNNPAPSAEEAGEEDTEVDEDAV